MRVRSGYNGDSGSVGVYIPFIYIYLGRTLPYPVHELPLIKWSGSFGVKISSIIYVQILHISNIYLLNI